MVIHVDNTAINRIAELCKIQNKPKLLLRIRVDGGGCSGFQYKLELTESAQNDDLIYENTIITDPISLPFLEGATISFEKGLIGSEFKISNPNAKSGCGCGISFSTL